MNSQKAKEYLESLKKKDTSLQLQQFLQKKKVMTTNTAKHRLQKYLQSETPRLQRVEDQLRNSLSGLIKPPMLYVKNPSLRACFELVPEQQKLELELASGYATVQNLSPVRSLISECIDSPHQLLKCHRAFTAAEAKVLEQAESELQSTAEYLQLQTKTILKPTLPISTSSYSLFSQFDYDVSSPKNLAENFMLQVASLAYQHGEEAGEKVTDIYAEAFQLNKIELDTAVGRFQDRFRQGQEIKQLVLQLKTKILTLNRVAEAPIADETIEDIFDADDLEKQLQATQAKPPEKTPRRDAQPAPKPEIAPARLPNTEFIRQQAAAKLKRELAAQNSRISAQLNSADQIAAQAYRKQINVINDQLAAQKQMAVAQKLGQIKAEEQRRMDAALRDAEAVRPEAPDDPERLHRDTASIAARKADTEAVHKLRSQLTRGNLDMAHGGEALIQGGVAAKYGGLAHDVLQKLVAQGLMGDAGVEAYGQLRATEVGNRFPQWALRDDVRSVFQ